MLIREKILEMVKISEKKCRRDYLWQRLLISHNETDEGYKRRSDTSDSSESVSKSLVLFLSPDFCPKQQRQYFIDLVDICASRYCLSAWLLNKYNF